MAVTLSDGHHNARNHFPSRIANLHGHAESHDLDDLLISCIFPNKKPRALLNINTNLARKKSSARTTIGSPVLSSSSSSSGASLSPLTSAASGYSSGLYHPTAAAATSNNNYTLKKPPPSPKPSLILANDTTGSGVINVALPRRVSQPNVSQQQPPQYKHGSPRMSLIRSTLTHNSHSSKRVRSATDKPLRQRLHQQVLSADRACDSSPAQTSPVQPSINRSASYSSSSSFTSAVPDSFSNLSAKACQAIPMQSNPRRGIITTSVSTTTGAIPLPGSGISPDPTDPNNIMRSKQAVSLANLFINYSVASTALPSDFHRRVSTGPTARTFKNPIGNPDDLIRSGSKLENAILDTFERGP